MEAEKKNAPPLVQTMSLGPGPGPGPGPAPAPAAAPAAASAMAPPPLSSLPDATAKPRGPVLRIRELDLSTLHPQTAADMSSGRYIAIGRPGSGKSSVIMSLIYAKKHIIPVAQIFSGTEDSNHFYSKRFPEAFLFGQLSEDAVGSFVRRQKLAMQYLPECPWALQLIDDCTDDPKILKRPLFQNIYKNGRHFKMLHILSLQYALDLLPSIRSSIDGTFIMREPTARSRKILWENYASIVPTFDLFNDIMDQLTTDYTAVFINNRMQSNNVEDCVFYYRADLKAIPDDWKFGCDAYWKFHDDRFDPSYMDEYNM